MEKGHLKPVVDSVYPLRQVKQAMQRVPRRENFGKIILKP
ncbi:MAG TPA: zinc-binding dehydrogenase [Candidatus Omnitrophota bacterium]|nr:zinc-binding dehydrogenase [Candidatus Omnitrophota bacterium]